MPNATRPSARFAPAKRASPARWRRRTRNSNLRATLLADIERDLLAPTQEARASVTYVYQAGATSLLDVLDAQRAFNDTMDTYYSAQAAYRRAQARLSLTVNKDVIP